MSRSCCRTFCFFAGLSYRICKVRSGVVTKSYFAHKKYIKKEQGTTEDTLTKRNKKALLIALLGVCKLFYIPGFVTTYTSRYLSQLPAQDTNASPNDFGRFEVCELTCVPFLLSDFLFVCKKLYTRQPRKVVRM